MFERLLVSRPNHTDAGAARSGERGGTGGTLARCVLEESDRAMHDHV
jgi:hypothetical protein